MSAEGTLLLDAGIWIASRDPDHSHQATAAEVTFDTDRAAAALDLTLYEVANWIVRRWSDSTAAAKLCRAIELRCRGNVVQVDPGLIETTASVAVEYGLSSYDAAYVAVARRHGWTLVSLDVRDLVSKGLAIMPDAAV